MGASRRLSFVNEVQIPTYRDLMFPTLVAIDRLGGSAAISELEETVPGVAGVTDEQMSVEFPPGSPTEGSKIINRLHWARELPKKIGALDNSVRGVWAITEGPGVFGDGPQGRRRSSQTRRQRGAGRDAEGQGGGSSLSWRRRGRRRRGSRLEGRAPATLKAMDPYGFERLAMRLLREAGFRNVEVTSKSGDGGIDGMGVYKVSLVSFPTYFQCKRYAGSVAAGPVRDFRGAMSGRGEKGLIITTGTFTPAAKAEATRDGAPPVDLIGGDELCELLKDYGLGVHVEKRVVEDVSVDTSFFDSV